MIGEKSYGVQFTCGGTTTHLRYSEDNIREVISSFKPVVIGLDS